MTRTQNKWQSVKQFFRFSDSKQKEASISKPPAWKDKVLADFSEWLDALPDDTLPVEKATVENCDMYTLLSEFSALRQEIKFQNREQNRTTASLFDMQAAYEKSLALFENSVRDIETLAKDIRQDAEKKTIRPFLDVRDAMVRGHAACKSAIVRHRWYRRAPKEMKAVAEGYEMAIRRFDRALSYVGISPIEAVGSPFDPKQMKAVGRQRDPEVTPGIVLFEQTGGFIRNGEVIRTAEVIVNESTAKQA